MELNEQIKKYRTEMNLSQEKFVEKIYTLLRMKMSWLMISTRVTAGLKQEV